jgi:hypothetical protein
MSFITVIWHITYNKSTVYAAVEVLRHHFSQHQILDFFKCLLSFSLQLPLFICCLLFVRLVFTFV